MWANGLDESQFSIIRSYCPVFAFSREEREAMLHDMEILSGVEGLNETVARRAPSILSLMRANLDADKWQIG